MRHQPQTVYRAFHNVARPCKNFLVHFSYRQQKGIKIAWCNYNRMNHYTKHQKTLQPRKHSLDKGEIIQCTQCITYMSLAYGTHLNMRGRCNTTDLMKIFSRKRHPPYARTHIHTLLSLQPYFKKKHATFIYSLFTNVTHPNSYMLQIKVQVLSTLWKT